MGGRNGYSHRFLSPAVHSAGSHPARTLAAGYGALLASPVRALAGPPGTSTMRKRQPGDRAVRDQQRSNPSHTAVLRTPKRRDSSLVSRVDVRATAYQGLGDFRVPSPCRHVERRAVLGIASCIHLCSGSNQGADNVAAAGQAALVRHRVQGSVSAPGLPVGVGAEAKQQLERAQVPLRRRVVKKGSTVPVMDTSQCRVGPQFAFGVFQQGTMAASHHQREHVRKHGAIARESNFERGALCQFKNAACITIANGGYEIVERALFGPSLRHFAVDAIVRRMFRRGRLTPGFTGVHDVGGGSLKQVAQCHANWLVHPHTLESFDHIAHPGLPFSRPDFETQMRFAQAQPPSFLSVLRGPAKKLGEKRREGFDRAPHALARKQRPQHRVQLHAGVERLR